MSSNNYDLDQQEQMAAVEQDVNTLEKTQQDLNRKMNLIKQLKITFESLLFNNNSANSPKIWSNGIMIIFTKNILSILQDELIETFDRPQRSHTLQSYQQVPIVGVNQLWSYITNTIKYNKTIDSEVKKLLQKFENEYNLNKNLNVCLEWIISSLKSFSLLKQLHILYEERASAFFTYYKKTSILNDTLFLHDFLIYIQAFESQDLSKLDEIQVFKLYNQQKNISIESKNRLLTVSDDQINVKNVRINNHRRLHSCPIILPSPVEPVVEQSSTMFDLEMSETSNNSELVEQYENCEDEDGDSLVFKKYSILDYISSMQNFYDRNLLDKENCHFLLADLAINSIELLKNKIENESNVEPQASVQMRNYQNSIIEPINLRSFHFKFLNDKNSTEHEIVDSNSSEGTVTSSLISSQIKSNLPEIEVTNCDEDLQLDDEIETIDFNEDNSFFSTVSSETKTEQQQRERRFSWEYDQNDYQYTPEAICKNLFKKYNEIIPNINELRFLIESKEYLEFTQKFLMEKNTQQMTDSTATLILSTAASADSQLTRTKQALIGDEKWAPVREQLIITNQRQKLTRIEVMKQQDYRCASCGIKIRADKIKQFRYCEYFSKYFCRCCHSKQESYIPSYIIFNLDFKSTYLVSNKAKNFLDKIYYEPLITLEDLNPALFSINSNKMSNLFSKIKYLRIKLVDCKRYIMSCRLAIELRKILEENFSDFLYTDTRVYSIDSLYKFKKSKMYEQLKFILNKIIQHILACEICSQQGFVCELCKNPKLIYPFDVECVIKCPNCLTCYHKACFKSPDMCLKCKRKKLRTGGNNSFTAPNF